MSNSLTPEELLWVSRNAEAVRALMRKSAAEGPLETVTSDPIGVAAHYMAASIQRRMEEIRTKLGAERDRLTRFERMAGKGGSGDQEIRELLEEMRPEAQEKIARFEAHLSALKNKIDTLCANPGSFFLPIGTIVRFTGVPTYVNSLGLIDDRQSYPAAGSVGVVTGLNRTTEFPLSVSVRREFKDGHGGRYLPSYDRFPTYFVDREMVEVIGYGLLPDGSEYKGFGFLPTHSRKEDFRGREAEMILEADGFYWRFHDFGGTQGIEALQAYEQIEEMSWLLGPLDHFGEPSAPVP